MIPVLIGLAVAGGVAYALSDDDKSNSPPAESSSHRVLQESQLPAYAKHKLEKNRHHSGGAAAKSEFVCSNSFDRDFSRIENMFSRDEHYDVIRDALQKIAKRAETHRNATAMNKVGLYYQEIYAYDAAQKCFERSKFLARS